MQTKKVPHPFSVRNSFTLLLILLVSQSDSDVGANLSPGSAKWEAARVSPCQGSPLYWGEGTREIRDFFSKCERVLWLRLSSSGCQGRSICFVLRPDISRWFRKVDESCLLSMKMNGQDFSKKQSLTKVHPSCLTGRSGKQFSCTWTFHSSWRAYHIFHLDF